MCVSERIHLCIFTACVYMNKCVGTYSGVPLYCNGCYLYQKRCNVKYLTTYAHIHKIKLQLSKSQLDYCAYY